MPWKWFGDEATSNLGQDGEGVFDDSLAKSVCRCEVETIVRTIIL